MSRRSFVIVLALAGVGATLQARAQAAAVSPLAGQASAEAGALVEPGLSAAELDAMIAPLGHEAVEDRRAAAKALGELGPDAVDTVSEKLADLRREGDDGVAAALKAGRERVGHETKADLLAGLVELRPEPPLVRTPRSGADEYGNVTRALTVVCLVRALAHADTTPAVRQMVALASDAGGALRPELARQIKPLGDRAVAALLEARRDPSPGTRAWAADLLESMGKRTPGDAVQTRDNQALADVLHAYASVHELDALPVVLSFVNSDRAEVRAAAREATLAYGQDAVWKLRETWAALMGEPAPDGISAADLAKKLFDAYDRFRLHDVYALLDRGLEAQKAGKLDEAVADFDQVLARQPLLDRRAEAAPAYLALGESLEDGDRPRALAALRKAVRLDETGPTAARARSDVTTLEGEDLLSRGVDDTEPFETALALYPGNARARAELDRLKARAEAGRVRAWRVLAAAAALLLAIAGIFVVGVRPRRARAG